MLFTVQTFVNHQGGAEGMAFGQVFLIGEDLDGSREVTNGRRRVRDHQTAALE